MTNFLQYFCIKGINLHIWKTIERMSFSLIVKDVRKKILTEQQSPLFPFWFHPHVTKEFSTSLKDDPGIFFPPLILKRCKINKQPNAKLRLRAEFKYWKHVIPLQVHCYLNKQYHSNGSQSFYNVIYPLHVFSMH